LSAYIRKPDDKLSQRAPYYNLWACCPACQPGSLFSLKKSQILAAFYWSRAPLGEMDIQAERL
jgi:hypothetical protein